MKTSFVVFGCFITGINIASAKTDVRLNVIHSVVKRG
jgi:hypothetical protein